MVYPTKRKSVYMAVLPLLVALGAAQPQCSRIMRECAHPPVLSVRVSLSPFETWTYIVTGESGGQWPQGSALVAWTLRAWQVYRGMPAELAGPRWGWNGWRAPTREAWDAVLQAWNQPPTAAPFALMQSGEYCHLLGSDNDVRYWHFIRLELGQPSLTLLDPATSLHMNCFTRDESP